MSIAATPHFAEPPVVEADSRADVVRQFDQSSKVRVLNFWATWCMPCVAEMPILQKIHESYRERGVSLVALSMDDALPGSREEARRRVETFAASRSLSFPTPLYVGSVPDIESEFDLDGEIPVTIVFDENGRELSRIKGIIDATRFRAELDRFLTGDHRSAK